MVSKLRVRDLRVAVQEARGRRRKRRFELALSVGAFALVAIGFGILIWWLTAPKAH